MEEGNRRVLEPAKPKKLQIIARYILSIGSKLLLIPVHESSFARFTPLKIHWDMNVAKKDSFIEISLE